MCYLFFFYSQYHPITILNRSKLYIHDILKISNYQFSDQFDPLPIPLCFADLCLTSPTACVAENWQRNMTTNGKHLAVMARSPRSEITRPTSLVEGERRLAGNGIFLIELPHQGAGMPNALSEFCSAAFTAALCVWKQLYILSEVRATGRDRHGLLWSHV